jgi:hypothetical protein
MYEKKLLAPLALGQFILLAGNTTFKLFFRLLIYYNPKTKDKQLMANSFSNLQLFHDLQQTITQSKHPMIDTSFVRKLALAFPDASEAPHFEKISFRIRKKIFATVAEKTQRVVLKLSLTNQSVFCDYDKTIFFPIPNAWGKKGWTIVEMKKVRKDMFKDALKLAYEEVKG